LNPRYFVDSLMQEVEPDPEERRRVFDRFQQLEGEIEQWSRLAASLLSRLAGVAALATPHESQVVRFRHLELVLWHDLLALLILVLQEAYIKRQVISLPQPTTQDELTAMANKLNHLLAGKASGEIRARTPDLGPMEGQVASAAAKLMDATGQGRREVLWDGISNILRQPEFSDSRRAGEVLDTLEEPDAWQMLIRQVSQNPGVLAIMSVIDLPERTVRYLQLLAPPGMGEQYPYLVRGQALELPGELLPRTRVVDPPLSILHLGAERPDGLNYGMGPL